MCFDAVIRDMVLDNDDGTGYRSLDAGALVRVTRAPVRGSNPASKSKNILRVSKYASHMMKMKTWRIYLTLIKRE